METPFEGFFKSLRQYPFPLEAMGGEGGLTTAEKCTKEEGEGGGDKNIGEDGGVQGGDRAAAARVAEFESKNDKRASRGGLFLHFACLPGVALETLAALCRGTRSI